MTTKEVTTDAGVKVQIFLPHEAPDEMREAAVSAMDRTDEKQVVENLATGTESGAFLYRFQQGNSELVGLSIVGIRALYEEVHKTTPHYPELVRSQHPNPEKPDSLIHYRAVKVKTPDGYEGWGEVGQPEYTRRRDGTWFYNPHAVPVALAKAKRNALKDAVRQKAAMDFMRRLLNPKAKAGTTRVLTEKDSRAPVSNDPARIQLRSRLFMLAGQAGLDVNKNRAHQEGTIAFVEAYLGVKLSEAPDTEIKRAGDYLDTPEGRAALKAKVVGS